MTIETSRTYPFKSQVRQLSAAEFRNLTKNGQAEYLFSNGRKLAFTLCRGENFLGQPSAHLDAFELQNYAGRFGLSVVSADHHLAEEDSRSSFPSSLPYNLQPFPAEQGNLYVAPEYRSHRDRDPEARYLRESEIKPEWQRHEETLFDPGGVLSQTLS